MKEIPQTYGKYVSFGIRKQMRDHLLFHQHIVTNNIKPKVSTLNFWVLGEADVLNTPEVSLPLPEMAVHLLLFQPQASQFSTSELIY